MTAAKAHQRNMFVRIITVPIKALGKARDFYVRSITSCSDRVSYGGMTGIGAMHATPLPRSFSAASSSRSSTDNNDDFTELLRAASSKSLGNKIDAELLYLLRSQSSAANSGGGFAGSRKIMPRSTTVAMGRIDEDKPFNLGEDNLNLNTDQFKYPRSRSYAPTKGSVNAF